MSNVSLVDGHIDEPKLADEQIIKGLTKMSIILSRDILVDNNVTIGDVLDLINRQKAEIERLEYVLMGVMHSVDKWLEGDELKQDEVNRAATMREKTLQMLEDSQDGHIRTAAEKDAEIERLRMQQSELIADYNQIAINAMKKFVERFKTKLSNFEYRDENPNMKQKGEWILHEVIPIEVEKLLKEMDGEL